MELIVDENSNIIAKIVREGVDVRKINKEIDYISRKVNNNKIGYFQFKYGKSFLRIVVLPKIINTKEKECVSKFLLYMKKSFELMMKYDREDHMIKNIKNDYLSILTKRGKEDGLDVLDELIDQKTLLLLKEILKEIKKCTKKYEKRAFFDSKVSGKINIRKNIVEINKSKIHQQIKRGKKKDERMDIVYEVIKNIEKTFKGNIEINRICSNILNEIKNKYIIKKVFNGSEKMKRSKVEKTFKEKNMKKIYTYLIGLLGDEGFFEGDANNNEYIEMKKMKSICFDPAYIFEYFVYDEIKNSEKLKGKVIFTKEKTEKSRNEKGKPSYYGFKIKGECEERDTEFDFTASNPDIIIEGRLIIDVKWKILNEIKNLQEWDVSKIKRDCIANNIEQGLLVYPEIQFDYKENSIQCEEISLENNIFKLTLLEMKII